MFRWVGHKPAAAANRGSGVSQAADGNRTRRPTAGQRFGFRDLLIGALASESDPLVWSLNGDFARLGALGLLEPYKP